MAPKTKQTEQSPQTQAYHLKIDLRRCPTKDFQSICSAARTFRDFLVLHLYFCFEPWAIALFVLSSRTVRMDSGTVEIDLYGVYLLPSLLPYLALC